MRKYETAACAGIPVSAALRCRNADRLAPAAEPSHVQRHHQPDIFHGIQNSGRTKTMPQDQKVRRRYEHEAAERKDEHAAAALDNVSTRRTLRHKTTGRRWHKTTQLA